MERNELSEANGTERKELISRLLSNHYPLCCVMEMFVRILAGISVGLAIQVQDDKSVPQCRVR